MLISSNCLNAVATCLGGAYYACPLRATSKSAAASIASPNHCTLQHLMMMSVSKGDMATFEFAEALDKQKQMARGMGYTAGTGGHENIINLLLQRYCSMGNSVQLGVVKTDNVSLYAKMSELYPEEFNFRYLNISSVVNHNAVKIFEYELSKGRFIDIPVLSYELGNRERYGWLCIMEKYNYCTNWSSFTRGLSDFYGIHIERLTRAASQPCARHINWRGLFHDAWITGVFEVTSKIKELNLLTAEDVRYLHDNYFSEDINFADFFN